MIFSIVKSLALGIWLGSLLTLGIAVAAPLFQLSPSKTLAGSINQVILGRINIIEWVALAIAVVCSSILLVQQWMTGLRTLRIAELVMLVIMSGVLWYYSTSISGRMGELRATIKDFDQPQETQTYIDARREFDDLHRSYTRMVGVNMLLLIATFSISVATARVARP